MTRIAFAASALLLWAACNSAPQPVSQAATGSLEYDGLTSLNDRCPVRGDPLNAAVEPVYVNGRPLGFC